MEDEKRDIAILTENELYRDLALCDENGMFTPEKREEAKAEIKEKFIKECIDKFRMMTEEQIREHIEYVLERTRKNKEEMKKMSGWDDER